MVSKCWEGYIFFRQTDIENIYAKYSYKGIVIGNIASLHTFTLKCILHKIEKPVDNLANHHH